VHIEIQFLLINNIQCVATTFAAGGGDDNGL
jgi:hypothetical protein